MLVPHLIAAVVNALFLGGVPFAGYWIYHRIRSKRPASEITERAGLRLGPAKYLGYSALFAVAVVILLVVFPPSLESSTSETSAFRIFDGLGLGVAAIVMALAYGIIQTGFPEELLFRGLITGSLSRRMPLVWANLIQALIFLAPHGLLVAMEPSMWTALPMIFVGALFAGWIRIRSGSIVGPWLIHAAANVTTCLSVAIRTAA